MPSQRKTIIREAKGFEFMIKYVWPFLRHFLRYKLTPRCKRCTISASYSTLENGLCADCKSDRPYQNKLMTEKVELMLCEFEKIIQTTLKQSHLRYHALVLFSGGKDSCYLIHRLLTDYPQLRLLALTVDNTFMSPIAMENVSKTVAKLGVEHMIFRPKASVMEKMFRYAFTHLNERGCAGTVDQFDGDFFSDVARNISADRGIPLIFCGLSSTQVEHVLGLQWFETSREWESSNRTEVAGIDLKDIFQSEEMTYWWHGKDREESRRPRMIFPYYVWNLDEETIKREVIRLGLLPKDEVSPLVTNHQLIPLMGNVDMLQFGFSSFEPEFSRMVREGKADRKRWLYTFEILEFSSKTGFFLSQSNHLALKRLDLDLNSLSSKHKRELAA